MADGGFFTTKERTTAWAFRGLITIIGAAGTIILWLAGNTLSDLKDGIKTQNQALWNSVSKLNESAATVTQATAVLTATVNAHLKEDNQVASDLHSIVKDHEDRIRGLEHGR